MGARVRLPRAGRIQSETRREKIERAVTLVML
jgi:hypothetical protein